MIDLAMAVLIGFAFHYRNRVGWRQSASVAVFAFFVVFPQAVLFPPIIRPGRTDIDMTVYLGPLVFMFPMAIGIIFHISKDRTKAFLRSIFLLLGACSFVTTLFFSVYGVLFSYNVVPGIDIPQPLLIPNTILGVDGESAIDAAEFETQFEAFIVILLLTVVGRYFFRTIRRGTIRRAR